MSIAKEILKKIHEVRKGYFSHEDLISHLMHARVEHYHPVKEALHCNKPLKSNFPTVFEYEDGSLLIVNAYKIETAQLDK